MLSQTTEYALRAMVCLAEAAGECLPASRIVRSTHVPRPYLLKVLLKLSQANLVISIPGRSGGYQLSREAKFISVLDVINAVDPLRRITSCPLGNPRHSLKLCALHHHLDQVYAVAEQSFSNCSIAQLCEENDGLKFLCPSPCTHVSECAPKQTRKLAKPGDR